MAQMDASTGGTLGATGTESGSGATTWGEAEVEVSTGVHSLLFSSRYHSAMWRGTRR